MKSLFYVAGAAALAFGVAALLPLNGQAEAQTWRLVLETNGQAYVMDYDLSLGDCFDAMNAQSGAGWTCEREGR